MITGDQYRRGFGNGRGLERRRACAQALACVAGARPGPVRRGRARWRHAAVGAFEVLRSEPGHAGALRLMTDARTMLGHQFPDEAWPWPESCLTYANAVPEALIVIGTALDDDATLQKGLSCSPGSSSRRPAVSTVGDAGRWLGYSERRASRVRPAVDRGRRAGRGLLPPGTWTREPSWARHGPVCVAWFLGWNDLGLALFDPTTGGGYDGLFADCVNLNEGAGVDAGSHLHLPAREAGRARTRAGMSPRQRTADGVHLTAHAITPDAARVVAKTFLPGQEFFTQGKSRASAVLERVLAMTEFEVETLLEEVVESFAHRHRDLNEMLEARFLLVAHRIEDALKLTHARRRLIGAYFTQEYAVEAAALFNPSMVAHPDQSGLPAGTTRSSS